MAESKELPQAPSANCTTADSCCCYSATSAFSSVGTAAGSSRGCGSTVCLHFAARYLWNCADQTAVCRIHWDQVGCHSPKKLPGTAGRKWRRSRGSVSSGRGTPGVQSPKADSVGSSVKMANIASNKATGNCPNTATVSFEDRERKRPKNP